MGGMFYNSPIILFVMKKIILTILYYIWKQLATRNKFPKFCEKINLLINKIEQRN